MAWEVLSEHVDKAEGTHRFVFVEKSVINRDGNPHTFEYTIRLGMGADGESCPHCNQPVQRGITLGEDGALVHATRGPVSPHDLAKEKIAELNVFHAKMDAYITKHKATLYRGPK